MKIVVLAGGLSPERDVSLSSGCMIANALMKKKHDVVVIDLYKGLKDVHSFEEAHNRYKQEQYAYDVPETLPDFEKIKTEHPNKGDALIGENIIDVCQTADITFLALHGSVGENGQVQALLDLYNISYTGTGYAGSLLAMDKIISKTLMQLNGVNTPKWNELKEGDSLVDILDRITFPCVVKPVGGGSSIGISIAHNEKDLTQAIAEARAFEKNIIIEQMIKGREFSVGILDDQVLPVIEIIPQDGFYDYKNKYQAGLTTEVCPAEIKGSWSQNMQQEALIVHNLLQLKNYSRIDFIVDENEKIYCLEANTLPGMTPTSLIPQEAQAFGLNYEDLCEKILEISLKK